MTTTSSATTYYSLKAGYDLTCRKIVLDTIIRCPILTRAFFDGIVAYDFPIGLDCAWKREWTNARQERLFLHVFALAALGSLDRAVFAYGSPARRSILALNFWFAGPRPCLLAAKFPRAAALRKSLTGLPMHQEPGIRELERIVDAVPGNLESV